jgi:hypothetical protein
VKGHEDGDSSIRNRGYQHARALTNITGVTVAGTTSIEEVIESVVTDTSTTGTVTF